MPKTRITIKSHNKKPYMAMMRDIMAQKNGIYSFVIRCDSTKMPGAIVDYVHMENVKGK